ncbi:MAG: RNA methyltransferase [Candidatus Micrarchaeota archaeon]|nr:RNA methyltransferase [Candidatus Micrarchaeota archaeon]
MGKRGGKKRAQLPPGERFLVILVEPQYGINIGAVARVMKNFGFRRLALVSPKCDHLGFEAMMHAKHAKDVLEGARVEPSLSAAIRGCRLVIGTTGVLYRHWHQTFRTPISPRQLRRKLSAQREGQVALVFGNEGTGLSEGDISACDFLVTIPSSKEYPVLNLSHAVAVLLYELSGIRRVFFASSKAEKEALLDAFGRLVRRYSPIMRNPKKVMVAFRRMVGKAMLSEKECAAIHGVIRRAVRELEKKGA